MGVSNRVLGISLAIGAALATLAVLAVLGQRAADRQARDLRARLAAARAERDQALKQVQETRAAAEGHGRGRELAEAEAYGSALAEVRSLLEARAGREALAALDALP